MKNLDKKAKKLVSGVGATLLVASLGLSSGIAFADDAQSSSSTVSSSSSVTSSSNTSSSSSSSETSKPASNEVTIPDGYKNKEDFQAYQNPLVAATLSTTVGNLPSAESGVSNWSSLPAGTTAYWNMQPDVSKDGESYGQIIVNFPDGSSSNLAVHVNTKTSSSKSDSQSNSDSDDSQSPVIVRDEKNSKNTSSETPTTKSSQVSDDTANVKGDSDLPQTSSKSNIALAIMGMAMTIASFALIARDLIKNRK